ncbi:NAD(P)H-dependent oxidoreductase [Mesorhizobium australicum]|uniref:Putative NADPH-quinone reductase (Modulator of drug activity B) n=1 Tax=Mesorhizobium australicum TaxID=536018 RepID=A0A1X7PK74_9HYPH|nr:NAD(P)H-dependent oxidoreductase [Mesorhizobium australicum]SMH51524.1 Putative NADPH-quinone reductase (modulator of drug activity B) [Mesorhizobium australicum]
MKALVVVGHPAADSFNHALAEAVWAAWTSAGCDVVFHDLYAEGFDPLLSASEARGGSTADETVAAHIAELRACDLLAVVHPNCWGAPPAMVKGWIDRVFAPEAAYTFAKGDSGEAIGLLRARAALILNTGNTEADREENHFGDPLDQIWRRCILDFCGVKHVSRALFGVVATSSPDDRRAWLEQAGKMARDMWEQARS